MWVFRIKLKLSNLVTITFMGGAIPLAWRWYFNREKGYRLL